MCVWYVWYCKIMQYNFAELSDWEGGFYWANRPDILQQFLILTWNLSRSRKTFPRKTMPTLVNMQTMLVSSVFFFSSSVLVEIGLVMATEVSLCRFLHLSELPHVSQFFLQYLVTGTELMTISTCSGSSRSSSRTHVKQTPRNRFSWHQKTDRWKIYPGIIDEPVRWL